MLARQARFATVAAWLALAVLSVTPQRPFAQTPAQMEYERQQRESRRQLEQQQEQQRQQQQLMNDNARRQQEESQRLNAPSPAVQAPVYSGQGASPQVASRRQATPVDVAANVAAAPWESAGTARNGEADFYIARSSIQHSGESSRLWEMIDFKTAQAFEGKPYFSSRSLYEYDCKRSRRRMLAASAYAGHLGKGALVGTEFFPRPLPWEPVVTRNAYDDHALKAACARI